MPRLTVLGAGAWGLALADYLARQGKSVTVWDRDPKIIGELKTTRTVNRPKGLVIPDSVQPEHDLAVAVGTSDLIISAVPSFAVKDICRLLVEMDWAQRDCIFVNCSKGIDPDGYRLPCEVFRDIVGDNPGLRYAVLAGPSHAEEVVRDVPTAVVSSAFNELDAARIQAVFSSSTFRVYTQPDTVGVELGGALKNVLAVALGVCEGRGFGDNTKAALITRGVAEIARLAKAKGAHTETAAGLSGLGDLIVTAMSKHSRNRGFGELLAQGMTAEGALKQIGAVVEGYLSSKSVHHLAEKYNVEMPIADAVYKALYENLSIDACISLLLGRDVKTETLS